MGQPQPKGLQATVMIRDLDTLFLGIIEELQNSTIEHAANCTEQVFKLSSGYMTKPTYDMLRQFQSLYFGEISIASQKEEVNRKVDNMIDEIQKKLDSGDDVEIKDIHEDEEDRLYRLGLSGLQKKLEALCHLDSGMRGKIVPALSSMQFEDAVRQRLEHIREAWEWTSQHYLDPETIDLEGTARKIADNLSSVEETDDYYKIVLKEDPPEGQLGKGLLIEF